MKRVALLIMVIFFTGCVSMEQASYNGRSYFGITKDNLVLNDASSLKYSGIILGRVVRENTTGWFADYDDRGVRFKNLSSGQELNFYDGDYFFMRLPEGSYEIEGLETKMGAFLTPAKEGFKFEVKNGEIIYIGNIVGKKGFRKKFGIDPSKAQNQFSSSKEFYGSYHPEGATLINRYFESSYTFYVIDDRDGVVKKFYELFPNLRNIEIKTGLMN